MTTVRSTMTQSLAGLVMTFGAVAGIAAPVAPVQVDDLRSELADGPLHPDRVMPAPVAESHPRYRPARIDVLDYGIDIEVEPRTGVVAGSVRLAFRSDVAALDWLALDAVGMEIGGVSRGDGRPLDFLYDGTLLTVMLPVALPRGAEEAIVVSYRAPLPQDLQITGPDTTNPGRMPAAYTYTQPEGSSTWFPCMDRPADKATASITVTVPEGFNALSNGALTVSKSLPGRTVWGYRMNDPIATYLISLAIGRYELVDLGTDANGVPLTLWTPPALRQAALNETQRTAQMMATFGRFTGVAYPFATYSQSVAEAWRSSMEHQTATTMGGWRIQGDGGGEGVVAHELAHQWFGDWVTCRQWGELWLNEGFASYLPYVFFDDMNEPDRALGQLLYWRGGYFGEAAERVHALSSPDPDMDDLFDSHAYEKGALVIHLARHQADSLGRKSGADRSLFTEALRHYLGANGRGTVVNTDLQKSLEAATGTSWQMFFDQWVRSPGHPVLAVTAGHADGALTLTVEQTQHTRTENRWRAFTFPLTVAVVTAGGNVERHVVEIYDDRQTFVFPYMDAPLAVVGDPDWQVPAEISVAQDYAAWKAAFLAAESAPVRITALRSMAALQATPVDAAVATAVLADRSLSVLSAALELWSADTGNRAEVLAIMRRLASDGPAGDLTSAGLAARAEEWLVRTQGGVPTRDQELEWQRRFLRTPWSAERRALLNLLDLASRERAQQFALERLANPAYPTVDRHAMVSLLARTVTPVSEDFLVRALADASFMYRLVVLRGLTAAGYDRPEIVDTLLAIARDQREFMVRAAAVDLLGRQKSSATRLCPELAELGAAGLDGQRPDDLADVRTAAAAAARLLACAP